MFKWTKSDAIVLPLVLLGLILVGVALGFLLRKQKGWIKRIPLMLIALLVLGLEIAKQAVYAGKPDFNYYVLPLHFCSLFVVLFPLSQLFGERFGSVFKPMAFCYAIAVMCLTYVNPVGLIGNSTADVFGSFHNFHTFFFHHAVIAYVIFTIALNDYKPRFKDCINVAGGVVLYVCYAAPCAYMLNSNYANILYSQFKPLESFRLYAGQIWYNVVLFIIGISAMVLICVLYNLIYKAIKKQIVQKQTRKVVYSQSKK